MKNEARAVHAGWDKVHNETNVRVGYLRELGIPGEKSYGIIVYLIKILQINFVKILQNLQRSCQYL